jgi:sodium-dependent phosphate cotransporter
MGDEGTVDGSTGRLGRLPDPVVNGIRLALAFLALYVFLVGIKSLETGIRTLGGDFVDSVFEAVSSPMSALAAGLLATVMVQSSSATTSIIVGLVGAGVMSAEAAVPMVMGANVGSAVTSTLASLGHIRQGAYFERAFAAATMQDFYNILAVAIFLPLELAFGLISNIARNLADWASGIFPGGEGGGESSIVSDAVSAPVGVLTDWMEGLGWSDGAIGTALIVFGLLLLFSALAFITIQMKLVLSGRIERSINSVLSKRGGLMAMAAGLVMTVAVHSSGITNSVMVPLVAAGVLSMVNAFPIILGADLGTTLTALIASLASDSHEALVIAMAHVSLNALGIFIFYPNAVRRIPIGMATWLARVAVANRTWVAVYILGVFVVIPLLILIVS